MQSIHVKKFDPLKYTQRAIEAGLSKKLAEFHAEELESIINGYLITKEDLKNELRFLENRLIWKLLGAISLILGISNFFHH